MKKNFTTIFASMLAVLTCASCSQNDDVTSAQDLTPKTLVISLPKTAETRNVEEQLDVNSTPHYTNVTTIYYDGGDNAVVAPWQQADIDAGVQSLTKVVKPKGVQVIVNLPGTQLELLKAAKTKSVVNDLLTVVPVAEQNQDPTLAGIATSAQLTTYTGIAEGQKIVTTGEGADAINTATVEISSITSRFEMGTIKHKAGGGLTALKIEKVFFNKYLSFNKQDAAVVNIPQAEWLPSKADPVAIAAWAMIDYSAKVTSNPTTGHAYAFQTYAGAVVPQIILRVEGTVAPGFKLADGTTGRFTGKYITINGYTKGGTSTQLDALVAHTVYQVAMDKPLDISASDIDDAANKDEVGLNVLITVKAWSKESLTPEIQ